MSARVAEGYCCAISYAVAPSSNAVTMVSSVRRVPRTRMTPSAPVTRGIGLLLRLPPWVLSQPNRYAQCAATYWGRFRLPTGKCGNLESERIGNAQFASQRIRGDPRGEPLLHPWHANRAGHPDPRLSPGGNARSDPTSVPLDRLSSKNLWGHSFHSGASPRGRGLFARTGRAVGKVLRGASYSG